MIAKITAGNKFYGVLAYNQKKVAVGQAKVLYQSGLVNTNPTTAAQTLEALSNSRVKNPVFHASLSFAEADREKLDDKKMLLLAKEYMEQMGYKDQPMIIYRHYDTKHPHVHVVTSRVNVNTQLKIKAQMEGRRSKVITDQMEIKHGLTISDKKQLEVKDVVKNIKQAMEAGRPENVAFLNKALTKADAPVRAELAGKGLVFYKVAPDGKRTSKSFKSSLFKAYELDYKSMQKTFAQNKENRIYVRNAVRETLQGATPISMKNFTEKLRAKKIETDFRGGTKGLLGVHYIYKGHRYKGSDLERALSWNNTKKRLELPDATDYTLREQLKASMKSGEPIRMKYRNGRIHFSSNDPDLDEKLNSMHSDDALELTEKHNDYQRDSKEQLKMENKAGTKTLGGAATFISSAFGSEVDEYLRKRKKRLAEDRKLQRRI